MRKEPEIDHLISLLERCVEHVPEGTLKDICIDKVKRHKEKQGRFDHAFTLAFSLTSNECEAADVRQKDIIEAVLLRLTDLIEEGEAAFQEAVMPPYDTSDEGE